MKDNFLKDNKRIAEFMGWNVKSLTTIPPNLHLSNLEIDNGDVIELKFHESWDWLMPVVEKIESVCEGVSQEMLNVNLYSYQSEVYLAVVEFIKGHNKK